MNRLLTKLIIFVIPLFAISCSEITVDNPKDLDYFMKFYGNYYNDQLSDIQTTQNEEIVLAGYRILSDGKENAWIIKTDEYGMLEWDKVFSGTDNYRGYGLFVGDNIYYAGYKANPDSSLQKGFLCQYNMNGSLIDSVAFNISADEVKDIKFLTKNANLRFIVHVSKNDNDEILIYEISNSNQISIVSTNKLYSTLNGRMYFYEQDNGNLYITGSLQEGSNQDYTDVMISRIVDDNIVWSYNYGDAGKTEKSSGIVLLNDSLYVAATEISSNEENVYILKLTPSGLDEEKVDVNLTGNNTSYSMIINQEKEFVFVGERKIDENNSNIFMARTSLNGSVLLENEYGYKGLCSGRFVLNLTGANKGFLIAGNMSTSGVNTDAKDVIVIKADELGEWIH